MLVENTDRLVKLQTAESEFVYSIPCGSHYFYMVLWLRLFTAVSTVKRKRPVLIYFCYQTDSEVPNTSIYSAIFLASPYYNYLKSTASTTMICWRCHSNSINTGSSLPNISDVKIRKSQNVIGIDMIRNNHIASSWLDRLFWNYNTMILGTE